MKTTCDPNTLCEEINPLWMFRVRPMDFAGGRYYPSVGIFVETGLLHLFFFHFVCFAPFVYELLMHGYRRGLLWFLLPVVILWLFLIPADINFRMQRATRDERAGFDHAFLTYVGYMYTVGSCLMLSIAELVAMMAFLYHMFA